MKKEFRRKNDEPLYVWANRIAPLCIVCDVQDLKDVLFEVAKQGYICGAHDTNDININK